MIKLLGLMALFLTCCGAGLAKSFALKKRVSQLELLKKSIEITAEAFRYNAIPAKQQIADLADSPEMVPLLIYAHCRDLLEMGQPLETAWEQSIEECGKQLYLIKSDLSVLRSYGAMLGSTDLDGQLNNCTRHILLLDNCIRQANQQVSSKGKLFGALGVLCGMFLVILLM